ncbi:MAG: PQQ-binding-like beta-propeller repeat protein [Alphaproteobacteria bacterium]|nr:PQQ-binding-like beta-propeller repeat protein [Alphaproteobacteria bacterium]
MICRLPLLPAALSAMLLLSGCGHVADWLGDTFSSSHKSNLRGLRVSLLNSEEELQVDATIAAVPVVLPTPFRNPDWPQPGGYPSNAMYHLDAPGPLRKVWSIDAGKGTDDDSMLTAAPVIGGGRIYVLDSEAHIRVFRINDGRPIWDKRLAPKNGTDMPTLWGLLGKPNTVEPPQGMGGGVAYDANRIFVTSGFGVLYAMDAATGKEVWRRDLGLPILNAPTVKDGRIFVSTHDNHFYAIAEADGRVLWDFQAITEPASLLASTSAAVAGEFVLAPFTSGELYAFRVQNGQTAWSDILSRSGHVTQLSELDTIAGRPVIDRDMVFATSQSGVTVGINLATGDRAWVKNIGGIQTPWAAGDYLYVVDNQSRVICLTRKEGKVRWVHQLPAYGNPEKQRYPILWAGPVLVSNRLVLVSSDGYAEAISPYNGRLLGRVDIPDAAYIAPVVANGTLYIYTNSAELVALR